jgi:hypothetical protein
MHENSDPLFRTQVACETRWPPCGKLNVRWNDLWEGRFNMRRREFITLVGWMTKCPFYGRFWKAKERG